MAAPDYPPVAQEQPEPLAPAAPVAATDSFADAADEAQPDAKRLHVYHLALDLHVECSALVSTLNRILKDQLERASLSIVLNTAESGGRRSLREKARYVAIARGSAAEVAALLDVLERRRLASPAAVRSARRLAVRSLQMLTRLHQSLS